MPDTSHLLEKSREISESHLALMSFLHNHLTEFMPEFQRLVEDHKKQAIECKTFFEQGKFHEQTQLYAEIPIKLYHDALSELSRLLANDLNLTDINKVINCKESLDLAISTINNICSNQPEQEVLLSEINLLSTHIKVVIEWINVFIEEKNIIKNKREIFFQKTLEFELLKREIESAQKKSPQNLSSATSSTIQPSMLAQWQSSFITQCLNTIESDLHKLRFQ